MAKQLENFLSEQIKRALEEGDGKLFAYVFPGGYPVYYLDGDNEVLCRDCAQKQLDEAVEEIETDGEPMIPRFLPCAMDANYEDPNLYCSECSSRIESAYAED